MANDDDTDLYPEDRLRRAALLCRSTLTNIAYFRGRRAMQGRTITDVFQIVIANNFLDMAVLEWCKLFGDAEDTWRQNMQKHSWRLIVTDASAFEVGLLSQLSCSSVEFEALRDYVRTYRDKFIAHLDELRTGRPPMLVNLKASAAYYLDYLLQHEHNSAAFIPAELSATEFYREREVEGDAYYSRLVR